MKSRRINKMNNKERQATWKERHINALRELGFTGSYRTLKTLENRAHRNAELYCSSVDDGGIESDEYERRQERIEEQVKKLFGGTLPKGFFINGDPRGYALKINSGNEAGQIHHPEYIPQGLHRDWGGFGILAPDEF
jgi:hypothetical protein